MRYYDKVDAEKPEFITASKPRKLIGLAQAVKLGDLVGELKTEGPKWVQIATENQYLGYMNGAQPFELTPERFGQMVANLRAHPSFKAGADGYGEANIIPWDYNHASEMNPTEGALAVSGAPAAAWTRDLEVRQGEDGKAQLWALTEFLEPAKGYVQAGQYKWASIAASFNAVDPVSGNEVGALISSIAFTNTPFIEGMAELAARRNGSGQNVRARHYFYDPANSPAEAARMFKELLGLPETNGADELKGELAKIRTFTAGDVPIGVDIDEIIGSMRTILGLPALSETNEVLDNADRMIQRLVEEATATTGDATAAAASRRDEMEILKILASLLGVKESESAIKGAVEDLVSLRAGIVKLAGVDSQAAGRVILEAVEKTSNASDRLKSIVKALGVEDPDGAVGKITDLVKQAAELEEAMPELKQLREEKVQQEEQAAEADVDEAMASRGLGAEMKDALLMFRKNDPAKFSQQFPKVEKPAGTPALPAQLTRSIAATPAGAVLSVAGQQGAGAGAGAGDVVDLDQYVGIGNAHQRALHHLSVTRKDWEKLDHDQQHNAAFALKRQPNVRFTSRTI